MDKKKIRVIAGILFCIATLCFVAGTVNHIVNTGEGIVSSICLALACVCSAVAFFKMK